MDQDLKDHLACMFGKKETDQEKMIKTGQMTPFGTIVNKPEQTQRIRTTNAVMTDFEKYLLDQSNLHSQKKKVAVKRKPKAKRVLKKTAPKLIENGIIKTAERENFIPVVVNSAVGRKKVNVTKDDDSDWMPDESDPDDDGLIGEPCPKRKKQKKPVVDLSQLKTIDDGHQEAYHQRLKYDSLRRSRASLTS